MQLWWVGRDGLEEHPISELGRLADQDGGFAWVDVPEFTQEAEAFLRDTLHAHPLVLAACRERNFVPTVHMDNTPGVAIKAYINSARGPIARLENQQLGTTPWAPSMTAFSSS